MQITIVFFQPQLYPQSDIDPKISNIQQKQKMLQIKEKQQHSEHIQNHYCLLGLGKQQGQTKEQDNDAVYCYQNIKLNQSNEHKLLGSKIFYKKDCWAKELVQTLIDCDMQSNTIQLHYGPYATRINVINFQSDYFDKSDNNYVGQGQFGKIYTQNMNDNVYAIKMIKLQYQNIFWDLKTVYKEYFMALAASQLKVGAKIVDVFGYEIVKFRNFAFFSMEFCHKFGPQTKSIEELRQSLDILHSLHFVHRDIKPQNIVWSCQYQRYVFIDFGLALIIRQNADKKTFGYFAGSFAYNSPQMKKLFILKKPGQVNLVQNDVFSFRKSKGGFQFCIRIKNNPKMNQKNQNSFLSCLIYVCSIKKYIYLKNFQKAFQLILNYEGLAKTFLHMINRTLQDKITEKISEIWLQGLKKIQKKMIQSKFKISENDQMMLSILQKNDIRRYWPYSFLKSKKIENIESLLNNQMWLQRIFFILNPPTKSEQKKLQDIQQSEQIINKIYTALKYPPTDILVKKIRTVYLFFYHNLKKFKNKIILQSISDILVMNFDFLNAIKIRQYVLELTEDPLEYCLQGLKYFLHLQSFVFFKRIIFRDHLIKIKQKCKQIKQNKQICTQILLAISKIEGLELIKFSDYFLLIQVEQILQGLSQLVAKQKNQLKDIAEVIQLRFCFLLKIQIGQIISNFNKKQLHQEQVRQKFVQLKQSLSQYTYPYCQNKTIANKKFYRKGFIYLFTQSFENANKNNLKQLTQYFYEISKGLVYFLPDLFILFGMVLIHNNKVQTGRFLIQQLKQQIKWIQYHTNKQYESYINLYWDIKFNFDNLIAIFRQKNRLRWSGKQEEQYFQLLQKYIKRIQDRVEKEMNEEDKTYTYWIIKVSHIVKKCYFIQKHCQDKIIQQLTQIFKIIKQHNISFESSQSLQNKVILLIVLALIKKSKLLKTQTNKQISSICLSLYEQKFKFREGVFLTTPHILEEIITIIFDKYGPLYTFDYIINIVIKIGSDKDFMGLDKIKQNMCKGINKFFQLNQSQLTKSYLLNFEHQHSNSKLMELLSNSYGCYLISEMLYLMNDQRELSKRYYYKIALKLHEIESFVYTIIISRYFLFFMEQHKEDRRKLVINLRSCIRYTLIPSIKTKSCNKIQRIVDKKLVKWPQIIKKSISMKICGLG